jgi:hypothetical protein
MKTISKAIQNRIDKINEMIPVVSSLDDVPTTYDGGTFPYYLEVDKVLTKNQFVYIVAPDGRHNMKFEKRYNVNNEHQLEMLKYDLSLILKTFKKSIKNNS